MLIYVRGRSSQYWGLWDSTQIPDLPQLIRSPTTSPAGLSFDLAEELQNGEFLASGSHVSSTNVERLERVYETGSESGF